MDGTPSSMRQNSEIAGKSRSGLKARKIRSLLNADARVDAGKCPSHSNSLPHLVHSSQEKSFESTKSGQIAPRKPNERVWVLSAHEGVFNTLRLLSDDLPIKKFHSLWLQSSELILFTNRSAKIGMSSLNKHLPIAKNTLR
mmetsp:Transcript_13092/g.19610  ORF Transcript_13092/g.19610 Transcript_13092/m.19610 type:complete len:141 (+) Transcript_13092:2161-2583(+)